MWERPEKYFGQNMEIIYKLRRHKIHGCLLAWGRRCAAGSFSAYAACAAKCVAGSCTRARQSVWGWHCTRQLRTAPAFPRVKHESAAVEERRLRAIGLMRTAFACTKSQSEARQASVGKTLAPVFSY